MHDAASADGQRRHAASRSLPLDRTALEPPLSTGGARQVDLQTGACPCGGGCPRCAAAGDAASALAISRPGDRWEVEADRIADAIVGAGAPGGKLPAVAPLGSVGVLQRACACGGMTTDAEGECPGCTSAKPLARSADGSAVAPSAPGVVDEVLRSPGAPLDGAARSTMEQRFGRRFDDVRIHTDGRADASARAVGARAYTVGRHVVFAAGQFAPTTRGGQRLLAHELVHTLQQAAGTGPAAMLQRTIGDHHDLSSPALSGDERLEACFDGEQTLRREARGPAVARLQQALLDLGFNLPEFGADGEFGDETERAVKAFQTSAGLTGREVDGVVGEKTIGLLDRAARRAEVSGDADAKSEDFRITGKLSSSAKEPRVIFFDLASAELDEEETAKLKALAGDPTLLRVTLKGMASEEGSASFNRDVARRRVAAVAEALQGSGLTTTPLVAPEAGLGDLDYRRRRAVKIIPEGEPTAEPTCAGRSSDEACPVPFSNFSDAITDALTMIDTAKKVLPPTKTAEVSLFDTVFRTDATARPAVVPQVAAILDQMQAHIKTLPDPGRHRCRNECDPICKVTLAYNTDDPPVGVPPVKNQPGVITLCQSFRQGSDRELRAAVVIHEGHHGTPGIESGDLAYRSERLVTMIDTATALKNAASFEVFVRLTSDPNATRVGPENPDVHVGLTSGSQTQAADEAIAWAEAWLTKAEFFASELYAYVRDSRQAGHFITKTGSDRFAGAEWAFFAPKFGLTQPPTLPTSADQAAMAAVNDRVVIMGAVFDKPITIESAPTGRDGWEPGPGRRLQVAPGFFALPPSRRLIAALEELIHATPGISAELEPVYLALIAEARRTSGLGGPTP